MTSAGDTIAAIASPPGHALRGMIRLSGADAHAILASLCAPQPASHRALTPGRLHHADLPQIACMACTFAAPHSYTGEHSAELWIPGNPSLLDRTLNAALHAGARMAEPGEFSFRAFRNGRLSLEQAEGVAATISATSQDQLRAAAAWRHGQLGREVDTWMNTLADTLALVEAGIDFTDQEDVVPIPLDQLIDRLTDILTTIDHLKSASALWRDKQALPRVVLVGPPSAGKSTLLNALLGSHRSVVHQAPGTTRDRIEAQLTLHTHDDRSVDLILIDLAGLDTTPGHGLDALAQKLAHEAIAQADLVVRCTPGDSQHPTPLPETIPCLDIRTKADLAQQPHDDALAVCSITGSGLDQFRTRLAHRLLTASPSHASDALALQPRHDQALTKAHALLRDLISSLTATRTLDEPELIADTLRNTLDTLGQISGRISEDDVIGRVFASFCVGK